jgi:hypothetical protein
MKNPFASSLPLTAVVGTFLLTASCGRNDIDLTVHPDGGQGGIGVTGGSGGYPSKGGAGGNPIGGSGGGGDGGGPVGGDGGYPVGGAGGRAGCGGDGWCGGGGFTGGAGGGYYPGGAGGGYYPGGAGGGYYPGGAGGGYYPGGAGGGYYPGGAGGGYYPGGAGGGYYPGYGGYYGCAGYYGGAGFPGNAGYGGLTGIEDAGNAGSADQPPPGGSSGAMRPQPYCPQPPPDPVRDEIAKSYCNAISRCCNLYESPYPDPYFCSIQVSYGIDSMLNEIRLSQASGRSMLDESALKACVANLQTGACRDLSGLLTGSFPQEVPGCRNVTQGNVMVGGGCDRSFECVDGAYCDGATCRDRPGADQPCPDAQCAAGFYCRGFSNGQRCEPKEADGRLCDSPEECASGYCTVDPRYNRAVCGGPASCTGRAIGL